jgi:hypothetical protein
MKPIHDWLTRYTKHELTRSSKGMKLLMRDERKLLLDAYQILSDQVQGGAECEGRCNPHIESRKKVVDDYTNKAGIEQEQYLPSEPFGDTT